MGVHIDTEVHKAIMIVTIEHSSMYRVMRSQREISTLLLFGASLSEPRIHEEQEAVLYVYMYVLYSCMYVCGVIISVRKELNLAKQCACALYSNDLKNQSSACMPAHSCQPLRQ